MAKYLRSELDINEISLCKEGVNQGAKIALFKSLDEESKNMPDLEKIKEEMTTEFEKQISDLTKSVEELTAERDVASKENEELKAQAEKSSKESDEGDNPLQKKLQELDPQVQEHLAELKKATDAAKTEADKASAEILKMKMDALKKSVDEWTETIPRIASTDEVRVEFNKVLTEMPIDHREMVMKYMSESEKLSEQAEILFKESGHSNSQNDIVGEAFAEIQKQADKLRLENRDLSPAQAREQVRKASPELEQREFDEKEARKSSH